MLQFRSHSLLLLLALIKLLVQLYSGGWDLLHLGLQLEGSALYILIVGDCGICLVLLVLGFGLLFEFATSTSIGAVAQVGQPTSTFVFFLFLVLPLLNLLDVADIPLKLFIDIRRLCHQFRIHYVFAEGSLQRCCVRLPLTSNLTLQMGIHFRGVGQREVRTMLLVYLRGYALHVQLVLELKLLFLFQHLLLQQHQRRLAHQWLHAFCLARERADLRAVDKNEWIIHYLEILPTKELRLWVHIHSLCFLLLILKWQLCHIILGVLTRVLRPQQLASCQVCIGCFHLRALLFGFHKLWI